STPLLSLSLPPPPRSTLFPYTTLFRSSWDSTLSQRIGESVRFFHRCRQSRNSDDAWIFVCNLINKSLLPLVYFVVRTAPLRRQRSEEHTSELQSRFDLVCRLLLEKKKK